MSIWHHWLLFCWHTSLFSDTLAMERNTLASEWWRITPQSWRITFKLQNQLNQYRVSMFQPHQISEMIKWLDPLCWLQPTCCTIIGEDWAKKTKVGLDMEKHPNSWRFFRTGPQMEDDAGFDDNDFDDEERQCRALRHQFQWDGSHSMEMYGVCHYCQG